MQRVVVVVVAALLMIGGVEGLKVTCVYPTEVLLSSVVEENYWNEFEVGLRLGLATVNANSALLPNHTLECDWVPYTTDEDALFGVFESVYGEECEFVNATSDTAMVLGPFTKQAGVFAGTVANKVGLNVVAPLEDAVFNDKERYPWLVRNVPSTTRIGRALLVAVSNFGWSKVGVVITESDEQRALLVAFEAAASEVGVEVSVAVAIDPALSNTEVVLQRVKDSNVRIIVTLLDLDVQYEVLRVALGLGLVGPPYVHVSASALLRDARVAADVELFTALHGSVAMFPLMYDLEGAHPVVVDQYVALFDVPPPNGTLIETTVRQTIFGSLVDVAHNTVRLAAAALHTYYEEGGVGGHVRMKEILRSQTVLSTVGPVVLDENGDYAATMLLVQFGEHGNQGRTVVGQVSVDSSVVVQTAEYVWPGGLSTPPSDEVETVREVVGVSESVAVVMTVMSGSVVVYGAVWIVFQVRFGEKKIVRLSSPPFNVMTIVGSMATVLVGPLLGFGLSDAKCNAVKALWLLGFALMYAPLFAKTWRVHRIFNQKRLKRVKIRNKQLVPMVLVVVGAFATMSVVLGVVFDTTRRLSEDADGSGFEGGDNGVFKVRLVEHCGTKSASTMVMLMSAMRVLVLLFGSWIAYEVRNVGLKALNESRWIGFAIYTTLLLDLISIPAIALYANGPAAHLLDVVYVYWSMTTVVQALTVLSLLFVPKALAIWLHKEDEWTKNTANALSVNVHSPAARKTRRRKNSAATSTAPESDQMLSVYSGTGSDAGERRRMMSVELPEIVVDKREVGAFLSPSMPKGELPVPTELPGAVNADDG